jgi:SRSO17 transposase
MAELQWEQEFARWLAPFWAALGDARRAQWAPRYVRGLLGPGARKSIAPLVEQVAPGDYQQLHHFVNDAPWEAAPLEAELAPGRRMRSSAAPTPCSSSTTPRS